MSVDVLGSVNMDIVAGVQSLPLPGETVTARSVARFPGGKGANQAIAAARLGATTRLIGAIGDDEYGAELRQFLVDNSVNVDGLATLHGSVSGTAFITVAESGENAIVMVPGANQAITPDELPNNCSADVRVSLTQFEMPLPVIRAFWNVPAPSSELRIINAAPAVSEGQSLFHLARYIVVNDLELACYSGGGTDMQNDDTIIRRARNLVLRDDQTIIVTLGAKGSMAVSATDCFHVESTCVRVVDTTGAGDCFCGALAASLSDGTNLRSAMKFANAAAAVAVGRRGAGPSMPTLQEVNHPGILGGSIL